MPVRSPVTIFLSPDVKNCKISARQKYCRQCKSTWLSEWSFGGTKRKQCFVPLKAKVEWNYFLVSIDVVCGFESADLCGWMDTHVANDNSTTSWRHHNIDDEDTVTVTKLRHDHTYGPSKHQGKHCLRPGDFADVFRSFLTTYRGGLSLSLNEKKDTQKKTPLGHTFNKVIFVFQDTCWVLIPKEIQFNTRHLLDFCPQNSFPMTDLNVLNFGTSPLGMLVRKDFGPGAFLTSDGDFFTHGKQPGKPTKIKLANDLEKSNQGFPLSSNAFCDPLSVPDELKVTIHFPPAVNVNDSLLWSSNHQDREWHLDRVTIPAQGLAYQVHNTG